MGQGFESTPLLVPQTDSRYQSRSGFKSILAEVRATLLSNRVSNNARGQRVAIEFPVSYSSPTQIGSVHGDAGCLEAHVLSWVSPSA